MCRRERADGPLARSTPDGCECELVECPGRCGISVDSVPPVWDKLAITLSGHTDFVGYLDYDVRIDGGAEPVSATLNYNQSFAIEVPLNPGLNRLRFSTRATGPPGCYAAFDFDVTVALATPPTPTPSPTCGSTPTCGPCEYAYCQGVDESGCPRCFCESGGTPIPTCTPAVACVAPGRPVCAGCSGCMACDCVTDSQTATATPTPTHTPVPIFGTCSDACLASEGCDARCGDFRVFGTCSREPLSECRCLPFECQRCNIFPDLPIPPTVQGLTITLTGNTEYISQVEVDGGAYPVFAVLRRNDHPRADYHFSVEVPLNPGENVLHVIARRIHDPPPCYSEMVYRVQAIPPTPTPTPTATCAPTPECPGCLNAICGLPRADGCRSDCFCEGPTPAPTCTPGPSCGVEERLVCDFRCLVSEACTLSRCVFGAH
jgi:hypothetical protein